MINHAFLATHFDFVRISYKTTSKKNIKTTYIFNNSKLFLVFILHLQLTSHYLVKNVLVIS